MSSLHTPILMSRRFLDILLHTGLWEGWLDEVEKWRKRRGMGGNYDVQPVPNAYWSLGFAKYWVQQPPIVLGPRKKDVGLVWARMERMTGRRRSMGFIVSLGGSKSVNELSENGIGQWVEVEFEIGRRGCDLQRLCTLCVDMKSLKAEAYSG